MVPRDEGGGDLGPEPRIAVGSVGTVARAAFCAAQSRFMRATASTRSWLCGRRYFSGIALMDGYRSPNFHATIGMTIILPIAIPSNFSLATRFELSSI